MPSAPFWTQPGVYTTAVGYAGGVTPNPTYHEVCSGRTGHTEAVLVVFDPAAISYETLLGVFFEGHDPTQGMRQGNDRGTQYRSAIYTTSPQQATAAEVVAKQFQQSLHEARYGAHHHGNRAGWSRFITPSRITSSISRLTPVVTADMVAPECPARSGWPD